MSELNDPPFVASVRFGQLGNEADQFGYRALPTVAEIATHGVRATFSFDLDVKAGFHLAEARAYAFERVVGYMHHLKTVAEIASCDGTPADSLLQAWSAETFRG